MSKFGGEDQHLLAWATPTAPTLWRPPPPIPMQPCTHLRRLPSVRYSVMKISTCWRGSYHHSSSRRMLRCFNACSSRISAKTRRSPSLCD